MAQSDEQPRRMISVSGEGTVQVEPDMAVVRFGVVTQSDDPETARAQNAEAARRAMDAIRELGVDERKMRLETLQLQPWREWDGEHRRWIERGFEATRLVVVEVEDLEKLPTLVTQIVQRGANRLNGISYELQDRDAARNDALREAALNAREKAELLATTLGERVGRVLNVSEQSFDFPRPMMQMEAAMAMKTADAAPEPGAYAAGELEVRATVQVVFEIASE